MGINLYAALDLGQRRDPSAIAIVERIEPVLVRFDYVAWLRRQTKLETYFHVRYLERLPLGTSYVRVAERVKEILRWPDLRGRCSLTVDATGVGAAVVDMLRHRDLGCEIIPVQITSGGRARRDEGVWNVPKVDLIAVVQTLLEEGRLGFAESLPRMKTLIEEMMSMRVRRTGDGNAQYGAWREGDHDDLALALALACWRAKGDERVVGEVGDGRLI